MKHFVVKSHDDFSVFSKGSAKLAMTLTITCGLWSNKTCGKMLTAGESRRVYCSSLFKKFEIYFKFENFQN